MEVEFLPDVNVNVRHTCLMLVASDAEVTDIKRIR